MDITEFNPVKGQLAGLYDSIILICYFLMVIALITQMSKAQTANESILIPLGVAVTIVALIASLDFLFPMVTDLFYYFPKLLLEDSENFNAVSDNIRSSFLTMENTEFTFTWTAIGDKVAYGFGKSLIILMSVMQVPFYILQFLLEEIFFTFLPIALTTFLFPGLRARGTMYILNLFSILSWPLGFALAAKAGDIYWSNVGVYDPDVVGFFGILLTPLIALIIIVLGTITTPFIMYSLWTIGGVDIATSMGRALYTASFFTTVSRASRSSIRQSSPSGAVPQGSKLANIATSIGRRLQSRKND